MLRKRFTKLQTSISRETLKLYYFNLKNKVPTTTPKVTIDVEVYDHPVDLEHLERSTIEERVIKGDRIFVALYQSKPVGYLFTATSSTWVGEIDDTLLVNSKEVYIYDAFTYSEFRGNRIFPALITSVERFFRDLSYSCVLIFVACSNLSSIKGIERAGFDCYQVVHFYNLLGLRVWSYKTRSLCVQSRFSNEN